MIFKTIQKLTNSQTNNDNQQQTTNRRAMAAHVYVENSAESPDGQYKNTPFILDGALRVYIEKDNAIFLSEKYIMDGEEQYEKKNIPEAIHSLKNALQVVQHGSKMFKTTHTPEPIGLKLNLRTTHMLLGTIYFNLGLKTESFEHYKKGLKIQEKIKKNDYIASKILFHYACLLFETNSFDEANVYVKEFSKSMNARLGDLTSCLYVTAYMIFGTFFFHKKHYEGQCLDFAKKANYIVLQIQKNKKCQDSECNKCAKTTKPEEVAYTHENLAHILAKLQKHDEALHEFIRAFEFRAEHKLSLKGALERLEFFVKHKRQNPTFMAALQQLHQKYQDTQTALVRHSYEATCPTCKRTSTKPLLLCSQCRTVRYCSVECQKADWKIHKPHCLDIVKGKKAQEQEQEEQEKPQQAAPAPAPTQEKDNYEDPTNDD